MIRYAISPGNHVPFPKREPLGFPCCKPNSSSAPGPIAFPLSPPSPAALLEQVRMLARQGVDFIQLREKHLSAGELACLARNVLALLEETSTSKERRPRLLLNTRADVAAAVGADGVHLPASPGSLTARDVRRLFCSLGLPAPVVSQSCHSLAAVRAALRYRPDFILFSPVFGKYLGDRLVGPAAGLEALESACAEADPIPVLALGGITPENTPQCLAAGASGIAAIRLFLR